MAGTLGAIMDRIIIWIVRQWFCALIVLVSVTSASLSQNSEATSQGWLGIQIATVNLYGHVGLQVTSEAANGPAAAAGISVGSVIFELDHKPILNYVDFAQKIRMRAPGTKVELGTVKNQHIAGYGQSFTVTLGNLAQQSLPAETDSIEKFIMDIWKTNNELEPGYNLYSQELNDENRQYQAALASIRDGWYISESSRDAAGSDADRKYNDAISKIRAKYPLYPEFEAKLHGRRSDDPVFFNAAIDALIDSAHNDFIIDKENIFEARLAHNVEHKCQISLKFPVRPESLPRNLAGDRIKGVRQSIEIDISYGGGDMDRFKLTEPLKTNSSSTSEYKILYSLSIILRIRTDSRSMIWTALVMPASYSNDEIILNIKKLSSVCPGA